MKRFIIAFCAAMLALLSVCALAETSVAVMGYSIADGQKWRFDPLYEEGQCKISAKNSTDENWNVKYESGVLTLRNISLTGCRIDYNGPAIVADGDLLLCLEGYNSLPAGGIVPLAGSNYRIGMYVGGNLKVSGEGSLHITMECNPDNTKDLGIIVVAGDLIVNSGTLGAEYDRIAGAWNSSAAVDVSGNIMITGGCLRGEAPSGLNGVAGIRAQGDITVLGGELDGISRTCYMEENGDRKGGNIGAGVMSEGGSIILDGGRLAGADNIQFGDTDYTGVRREGAMGAGIYARKNIIIKSGALWTNAFESKEGYALSCLKGEISIPDESLDIWAQEYRTEGKSWDGKISPGKRTIHTAEGKIAREVMIRDAVSEIPEIPETGDGANLVLWSVLAAISIIGMMALRRRKEV